MLFGAETYTLTKLQGRRLAVAQSKERCLMGTIRRDKISDNIIKVTSNTSQMKSRAKKAKGLDTLQKSRTDGQ